MTNNEAPLAKSIWSEPVSLTASDLTPPLAICSAGATVEECLAQLAQLEGGFLFFRLTRLKEIKGLADGCGANRRVVPTIPIFF